MFQRDGLDAFQRARDATHAAHAAGRRARSSRCCRRCSGCSANPRRGMRIRTALVTARSAPAHERAIRTLMDWHIEVDEAMFLGGLPKGEFLREFEPDFFFDDQTGHVESAAAHVPAGHVASGVQQLPDQVRAGKAAQRAPGRARARRRIRRGSARAPAARCSASLTRWRDRPDQVAQLLLRDAQQRRRRPGTAPGGTAPPGCAPRAVGVGHAVDLARADELAEPLVQLLHDEAVEAECCGRAASGRCRRSGPATTLLRSAWML